MTQDFLKPALNGQRFEKHSLPLELLKDFAVLQEMLVEVAKWEFRRSNPDRKRTPKNFATDIDLHLEQIEEGSAILKITLVFATLFPSAHLQYFEQARADIVSSIDSADRGGTPTLPPKLLNYFDRFGRGLRAGESISFDYGSGTATLSPDTRKRLVRFAEIKEWTDEVTLRVRVPGANKLKGTFDVELSDGITFGARLENQFREEILQAFQNYGTGTDEYVVIQGIAVKDRDDRPKGFHLIEHVVQPDPLDISFRLDELANLDDGWYEGKGTAPKRDHLLELSKRFDTQFDASLPLPHIYPTADGGIQAEWDLRDWSVSLEIGANGLQGDLQAVNLDDQTTIERSFSLDGADGWSELNETLSRIEGRKTGDEVSAG